MHVMRRECSRRLWRVLLGLCAVGGIGWLGSGCRMRPYLAQRGRDAADILTVTAGPAIGVKLRAGPVHLSPLILAVDTVGLRGGEWFYVPGLGIDAPTLPQEAGALWWNCSVWDLPGYDRMRQRGKAHAAAPPNLSPDDGLYGVYTDALPFLSTPRTTWPGEGVNLPRYPTAYHAQLELSLGLGIGFRLGVNPGEALDFLLGWCFLDLYGDDKWSERALR